MNVPISTNNNIDDHSSNDDKDIPKKFANAYFTLLGFSVCYAFIAGLFCIIEPACAGGGIAEVKAYLNGVNVREAVRVKVLITKMLSMAFASASGLPIGREGPMIHCGSIVGAAISQGRTKLFGWDTSWTKFQDLRNDRSKRDFVTFGAAAGVTAAFQAPIGGIMFTLEEGASFWSTSLTFRAFFCALMTQLTYEIITSLKTMSYTTNPGNAQQGPYQDDDDYIPASLLDDNPDKFNLLSENLAFLPFGSFKNTPKPQPVELIFFILIGASGGLLGALFNYICEKMYHFRTKYNAVHFRMLELLTLTSLWTTISFVLPMINREGWCQQIPTDSANWTETQYRLVGNLNYLFI